MATWKSFGLVFATLITISFSDMPYYVKLSGTYTWDAAKQACEEYGTSLATIQDSGDDAKVAALCPSTNCWIGYTTKDSCSGCWYWVGEHISTFTHWGSGQPDIVANACARMYGGNGNWYTNNCNSHYYAICNPNTVAPTYSPSAAPTFNPTTYGHDCEERGYIYHHNWDDPSTTQSPYFDYYININSNDLSVEIEVNLEYIGYSTAKSEYGLGSTYVLDFKPFDGFNDHIDEPRNCANRIHESFINKTFDQYWSYSTKPYQYDHYGTMDYLAYPPSGDIWSLTMGDGNAWIECSRIKYKTNLNWIELNKCKDNDANKLMNIDIDSDFITLSGIFYIDLVSPKSNDKELNVYYVQPLLQKSFAIKVSRSVHTISSTNIESFLITIYQSYRLFDFTYSTNGAYLIQISTQIANYMQLTFPLVITSPTYQWQIIDVNDEQCIFERDSICTQYWEIYMPTDLCPLSFSGLFHLQFNAICNTEINDTQACDNYINAYNDTVQLEFILSYNDPFQCNDSNVEEINFNGLMLFYNDDKFSDLVNNNDEFRSGIDIIYGEIIINIPNNSLSVFEVSLLNIWICTINPIYDDQVSMDVDNILFSGCFDSNIVDSGSTQNVMINTISQLNFDAKLINSDNVTNIVRYSFLTPSWAARDKLYIHCQVKISLINNNEDIENNITNRRLLGGENIIDFGDIQSIVHLIQSVFINNNVEISTSTDIQTIITQINIYDDKELDDRDNMNLLIFIFISIIILFIFIMIICCICYIRMKKIADYNSVNKQVEQSQVTYQDNKNETNEYLDDIEIMEVDQIKNAILSENTTTNILQYVE